MCRPHFVSVDTLLTRMGHVVPGDEHFGMIQVLRDEWESNKWEREETGWGQPRTQRKQHGAQTITGAEPTTHPIIPELLEPLRRGILKRNRRMTSHRPGRRPARRIDVRGEQCRGRR